MFLAHLWGMSTKVHKKMVNQPRIARLLILSHN